MRDHGEEASLSNNRKGTLSRLDAKRGHAVDKKETALALAYHLELVYGILLAWSDTQALYEALEKSGYHYNSEREAWEKIN